VADEDGEVFALDDDAGDPVLTVDGRVGDAELAGASTARCATSASAATAPRPSTARLIRRA